MKYTHLFAVAALLGQVVLADITKDPNYDKTAQECKTGYKESDDGKKCEKKKPKGKTAAQKAKEAKEKAAKEKAAKEKAAKEKAAKEKAAKEKAAKAKAAEKKAKEEKAKKLKKLAEKSCKIEKLVIFKDKACKKVDDKAKVADLKKKLYELRVAMYNGACVMDTKDSVYIKATNKDCLTTSMTFKKYSDATCTTEAASAKLVKYKDLAAFGTGITFK